MLAALTALSWIKQDKPSFPAQLTKLLLGALLKPKADRLPDGRLQIYTEMLPQYKQAQGAMTNLLNAVCLPSDMLLDTILTAELLTPDMP